MGSVAFGTLDVNAWVAVHDGCQISCTVNPGSGVAGINRRRGSGGVEEFEFWFETEALREFLAQGADALAELDRAADEHAANRSLPAPVAEFRDAVPSAQGPG